MNTHFNNLTPAEAERLALLMEECGEVIQIIGKILRHGYESCHPNDRNTNRCLLIKELGDLNAAQSLLFQNEDISQSVVATEASRKLERVAEYLHHNQL